MIFSPKGVKVSNKLLISIPERRNIVSEVNKHVIAQSIEVNVALLLLRSFFVWAVSTSLFLV